MEFSTIDSSELDQFRNEDIEWTSLQEEAFLYSEPFTRSKGLFISEDQSAESDQGDDNQKKDKEDHAKVNDFPSLSLWIGFGIC